MYNVAIIGAGPAGIFSALEIIKLRPEWKVILIEKGQKIEKRKCPIREGSPKCVNCKRCGLLCGWGGAGAFSDGKLTLTPDVGGHLVDYMSREKVEQLIKYADNMYLEHGATDEVFGTDMEVFREIEREAALAELKLVHSPVRHLGTERSLDVLKHMQDFLDERITILNNVTAQSLIVECEQVKGIVLDNGETIKAQYTIIAPGREGCSARASGVCRRAVLRGGLLQVARYSRNAGRKRIYDAGTHRDPAVARRERHLGGLYRRRGQNGDSVFGVCEDLDAIGSRPGFS